MALLQGDDVKVSHASEFIALFFDILKQYRYESAQELVASCIEQGNNW